MPAEHVRLSRRELYDLIWSEPVHTVAARYDLTDNGLRKLCLKHRIPLPPQGHWQKVRTGNEVRAIPLPALADEREIVIRTAQNEQDEDAEPSPFQPAMDVEAVLPPVVVHPRLIRPHPTAEALRDALKGTVDRYGAVHADVQDAFLVRVHPGSISRVVRLADALARACDARGFWLSPGKVGAPIGAGLQVVVDGLSAAISINERPKQEPYTPSAADLAKRRRGEYVYTLADQYVPTGQLTLKIDPTWGIGVRGIWTDSIKRPLEQRLGEVMLALRQLAICCCADQAREAARQARFDAEQRKRATLRPAVDADKRRIEKLEADAAAWRRAEIIRGYAAARAAADDPQSDPDLEQWLVWATDQADRIDPLRPTPPSILDTSEAAMAPLSIWHFPRIEDERQRQAIPRWRRVASSDARDRARRQGVEEPRFARQASAVRRRL